MEQFLEFIHEVAYNITEQLFGNLDKVLEVHVITDTQWVVIENDQDTSIQEFIHNTRGTNDIRAQNDIRALYFAR